MNQPKVPREYRLNEIVYADDDDGSFSDALRAAGYPGGFYCLDPEAYYPKLVVMTAHAAELWVYDKDGGPSPLIIPMNNTEYKTLTR
jgi:hypothetical protein